MGPISVQNLQLDGALIGTFCKLHCMFWLNYICALRQFLCKIILLKWTTEVSQPFPDNQVNTDCPETVGHSRTFKFDHYKVLWHVTKPIDDDVRGLVTCYQTVMIGLVTCYRTVMIGPVTCYRTYHHNFLKWFLYHFLNAGIIGNKANILKNIEENLDKHRKSKNLIFEVR